MISRYAVVGNPIAHSLSPAIHQQFAEQTHRAVDYQRKLVAIGQFAEDVGEFFADGGAGLNITVPFKLDAYQFADRLTERAKNAGAVNTLIAHRDANDSNVTYIEGDTTDGCGLLNDLSNNLHWQLQQKNILVLGAGGAVRGVIEPLLAAQPASLLIANRSVDKAEHLADMFNAQAGAVNCPLSAQSYQALSGGFDIIINGTSASLGNQRLPIAEATFNQALCYDMMYAKTPTAFLQFAARHGAKSIADGLGMLVEQAAESFYLWQGVRPETAQVITLMRDKL